MYRESVPVRGALCRALRVLRLIGVAPLHFSSHLTMTYVRVSNALLYYGYILSTILNGILLVFIITLGIFISVENKQLYKDTPKVEWVVIFVKIGCVMAINGMAAYGARNRMKHMILQLQHLNMITMITSDNVNGLIIVKDRKHSIIFLLGTLVLILVYTAEVVITTDMEIILKGVYIVSQLQCVMVLMTHTQIVLLLCMIQSAVQSYNCELQWFLHAGTNGENINKAVFCKLKRSLWCIARYYVTNCEDVRQMSSHEGALMLLSLIVFIVHSMLHAYFLSIQLYILDNKIFYLKMITRLSWISFYVLTLGILLNACDMRVQTQKTRILTTELMNRCKEMGEMISKPMHVLTSQLLIHQPIFNPLSVCTFDRSLFVTVITGSVTFLIHILKLHIMEKSTQKE